MNLLKRPLGNLLASESRRLSTEMLVFLLCRLDLARGFCSILRDVGPIND